jgi:hypothetical protein
MDTKIADHKTDLGAEAQEVEVVRSSSTSGQIDKEVPAAVDVYEENGVHHKARHNIPPAIIRTDSCMQMNIRLFLSLTAMSFLWVGSQIPLYLFGSVLPRIYQDIGGVDRYVWFVIGYLIPNAALCPFVGALSDLFGRRMVAVAGQICLIVGPIITATANTMNIAIGTLHLMLDQTEH